MAEQDVINYWMVAVPDGSSISGFVRLPIDAYETVIRSGDVVFVRSRDSDELPELVGWGFCEEPFEEAGTFVVRVDVQPWSEGISLTSQGALWSLAYHRDPEHSIHGLSAREVMSAVFQRAKPPPPLPDPERAPGSLDEILLFAAELAVDPKQAPLGKTAPSDTVQIHENLEFALVRLGQLFPDQFPAASSYTAIVSSTDFGEQESMEKIAADIAEDSRYLPPFMRTQPDRSSLWSDGIRDVFPALDGQASEVVGIADALARRLPWIAAATDAHLVAAYEAQQVARSPETRPHREAVIAKITEDMDREQAARWRAAVGVPAVPPIVAPIAPDSAEGIDRLNRMPDITAFANAIASRALKPPLSIGVFGEWGAGKTFFMGKLRDEIDRINTHVQELPKNERIGYCERIAQVEFNAWHYAETDLWPSLIHHLLANLAVGQGEDADELTERLLDELEGARTDVAAMTDALDQAESAVETADGQVDGAQNELKEAEQAAAELQTQDVWELVNEHPDIQDSVNRIGGRFGQSEVGGAAVELYGAVSDTIATVTAGWNILRLRDEDAKVETNRGKTILTVVLITALAIGGALLVEWLSDSLAVAGIIALAGPAAAAVAGFTRWLQIQNERGDKVVAALRKSRDTLVAEREEVQEKVESAQKTLGNATAKHAAAEVQLQRAETAEAEARAALDAISTERRLADFVASRLGRYETHLGLVTAVRRDFERLGELLDAVRRDADQLRERQQSEGDGEPEDRGEVEDEHDAERERLAIDRIVVYIDDLDRCRPETVVKVLEAVHLLLAFEFIVVVVGVDARWVGRALLKTYPTMLGSKDDQAPEHATLDDGPPDTGDGGGTDSEGKRALRHQVVQRPASEHDYIEKIFQVPYWLEPMTPASTGKLVSALFGPTSMLGATEESPGTEVSRGDDGDQQSGEFDVSDAARVAIATIDERLDDMDVFDPNPVALTITDRELRFMEVVYPLVSRSPRSAKRFVNVYRIIKAGLAGDALDAWVGPDNAAYPCHAAMLLLALVCGAPQSSTAVLGALSELNEGGWDDVAKAVDDAINPDAADELRRWRQAKAAYDESDWDAVDASLAKAWLPKVTQYSFRSGHLDL